jgi:hypothetical protein
MGMAEFLISSVTVGAGGAANIEFTSIPSTYTDLIIKLSTRLTTSPQSSPWSSVYISLNNSSSNFTYRLLYGTGSAAASQSGTNEIIWVDSSDATSSTFGNAEIYIPNYAGSTYKSMSSDFVTENNSSAALLGILASLWSNTSTINSFKIAPSSGNFAQHSTAYLYGIKNS